MMHVLRLLTQGPFVWFRQLVKFCSYIGVSLFFPVQHVLLEAGVSGAHAPRPVVREPAPVFVRSWLHQVPWVQPALPYKTQETAMSSHAVSAGCLGERICENDLIDLRFAVHPLTSDREKVDDL